MKAILFNLIAASLFIGCGVVEDRQKWESDFFPLEEGMFWKFDLTHSDIDPADPAFVHPSSFTTRVTEQVSSRGRIYMSVVDYYIPGPFLGDALSLRSDENAVFINTADEERLFYSIDAEGSEWSLPFHPYKSSEVRHTYWASVSHHSSDELVVRWSNRKDSDFAHDIWEDHFLRGVGRVKIVSKSQAFGTTVWEMVDNNIR